MASNEVRKYFSKEAIEYLENSFKKIDFSKDDLLSIFKWLSTTPKWSTIRINRNAIQESDFEKAILEIQTNLDESYKQLNARLTDEEKINDVPKCQILSDLINECIIFNCSAINRFEPQKKTKMVIIDLKCAQAVFRGADIFLPGVISLSPYAHQDDEISIFADLEAKCLKGSDANLYAENNPNSLFYIGNGWLMYDRDYIFKNSNSMKNGVGVKIKVLKENYYIPSLDSLDESKYFLQNLPSIICAKVLDPQKGELILDICAAPGGKTTHIAEIVRNQSRIIAFDKIANKIERMKTLCTKLGANIECYCQDATKIDPNKYAPNSFDRILADVPCSALGQRPLIYNDVTPNQLKSYIGYQKMILEKAVELLKPGGVLVYSTCTITIEENEEQVSWLLNKFNNMKLITQEPFYLASSRGFKCDGLNDQQTSLLQRFMPDFKRSDQQDLSSVYSDTNGFFIAKFMKL